MGLHSAGGTIILNTYTSSGAQGGVDFVDNMSSKLCGQGKNQSILPNAGWTFVEHLKAEISFIATFFSVGSHIDFTIPLDHGGTSTITFTFTDGSIPGNVIIGGTLTATLANFGTAVHASLGWDFSISGSTIRFYNILYEVINDGPPSTLDTITNMILATVTPTGTIGFFDYNPDVTAGNGRTHDGGHHIRSAKVTPAATAFDIDIFTQKNTVGAIAVAPHDRTFIFDFDTASWTLLANKYQFFLMQSGAGALAATFIFASHLYPARGCTYANYMAGPWNGNDGKREGFQSVGHAYYVDIGSPFQEFNTSDVNKLPGMCFPGFSYGIPNVDKLINPLNGIPVLDDMGHSLVYDAFLAAPKLPNTNVSVIGWLWDALIYSNQLTMDTQAVTINGKTAYVVLSQPGSKFDSQGSLVVQSAT